MSDGITEGDGAGEVEVELELPVLKQGVEPGSGPTAVKRLQHMLNDRDVGPLTEDGDFGPKTLAAVKAFQEFENLTPDGIVGKNTWGRLLTLWLLFSEPG